MKSSSSSLTLISLISVLGLVACSPDSGSSTSSGGPGGGDAGGGDTSANASSGGEPGSGGGAAQGSPTTSVTSAGGDGDGGTSGSSDGGGPSNGGGGPGNGGGNPGAGGDGTGGDVTASSSTGASDIDGDGFTIDGGDCDDTRDDINPDATEICNTRDDNCDGNVDEGFDVDGDTYSTCLGDCDDNNGAVNPGGTEVPNGIDDDCDGDADGPFIDNDGDGYTEAQGDCNDDDDKIGPGAIEFQGNNVDDDCDGQTDEGAVSCDSGLSSDLATDYGRAIGLCNGEIQSGSFDGPLVGRLITGAYGDNNAPLNRPTEGASFVHLSSGLADNSIKNGGYGFDGQTGGGSCTTSAHPAPLGDPGACGFADPADVCDKTEVSLSIRVPQNAQSFSYDFQFMSAEYQVYRCSIFDDTFLAMLSSQAFNGNISFDLAGNVMSVNTGFFDICYDDFDPAPPNICTTDPVATLANTGFDANSAGATVPLTTTAPVVPGEIITLRFIIFDEGDDALDSSVLIDNFRWSLDPSDGPGTEPTN